MNHDALILYFSNSFTSRRVPMVDAHLPIAPLEHPTPTPEGGNCNDSYQFPNRQRRGAIVRVPSRSARNIQKRSFNDAGIIPR